MKLNSILRPFYCKVRRYGPSPMRTSLNLLGRVAHNTRTVASSTSTSAAYKHFHSPENAFFYNSGQYKPLNLPNNEGRLLRIDRTSCHSQGSLISLTLQQPIPLASAPLFIPISYRSGDPSLTAPVLVNGLPFSVFAPLAGALARVSRLLDADPEDGSPDLASRIYLWADQVCINQSDPAEKAAQVALMRQIYAAGGATFAWLGDSPAVSQGLVEVRRLANLQKTLERDALGWENEHELGGGDDAVAWVTSTRKWAEFVLRSPDLRDEYGREALRGSLRQGTNWAALHTLLTDSYWRRAWIAQELLVGRVTTINTDTEEADRTSLTSAMRALQAVRFVLLQYFVEADDDNGSGRLVPTVHPAARSEGIDAEIAGVSEGLGWLRSLRTDLYDFFLDRREAWVQQGGFDMPTLLLHARECEVTDPLDRLYAIAGLALEGVKIEPDYGPENTVANTYVKAAKAAILGDKDLNFLCFAEERSDEFRHGRCALPSWVPDWRPGGKTYSLVYRVKGDPRAPEASRGLSYTPGFFPGPDGKEDWTLACAGVVIDEIAESKAMLGKTVGSYASWEECLVSWGRCAGLDLCQRAKAEANRGDYVHNPGDTKIVAFWSTVCRGIHDPKLMRLFGNSEVDNEADLAGKKQHCREQERESSPAAPSSETQATGDTTEQAPWTTKFGGMNIIAAGLADVDYLRDAGWCFFRSPKGYYGLARSRVQPGDVVCLLFGADVPFVLRRHEGGYLLMGEAYVHGLMYGRVTEELEKGEGGWEVDALCIY